MSNKPASQQTQAPTPEQVSDFLVTAFGKLFTLDEVQNNRRRCFATIINYQSPKSGIRVDTILTAEDVGIVIDRIRDAKIQRVIGEASF